MPGELVLLTGGTGFLGSAILVDLLKSGYRVRVTARSQAKIDQVRAAPFISKLDPAPTQLMFVMVPDMAAPGAYESAVQGVDFIIHAAAPVHGSDEGTAIGDDQLGNVFVTASVQGNLGILQSAREHGQTVRRIVMTSSTVAIAPPEVCMTGTGDSDIVRGPESRVVVPKPPYDSQLQAYCVGKAAALHAAEAFMKDNSTSFDLISIIPSWIFGQDELAVKGTGDLRTGSTHVLIQRLLTGNPGPAAVGNAVLCADVARAHVRALDPDIKGNQSFLLNTEVEWEDTVPIAKRYFPDAFNSGVFQEGTPQQTLPVRWDAAKAGDVLGIELAPYDTMVKEVVGQYLDLKKIGGN